MGTLYVVATPIGNLEDISLRAIKILLTTPVVACEDTRHTGNLIKILKERYSFVIPTEMEGSLGPFGGLRAGYARDDNGRTKYISVRDWNEAEVTGRVLEELAMGDVALVSDAGTPLISDPGFKVVRAAREAGFRVSPIPGPSAAIAALSASGLPTNKFMFLGFLPKKWELLPEVTTVIYESPVRAKATLEEIKRRYPEAQVIVAKELTKIHEEIFKMDEGTGLNTKGEITILVYLPVNRV